MYHYTSYILYILQRVYPYTYVPYTRYNMYIMPMRGGPYTGANRIILFTFSLCFSLFFYRSDPPNYLLRQSLERRVIYIEMRSHDYFCTTEIYRRDWRRRPTEYIYVP